LRVEVLFFGRLRAVVGSRSVEVHLDDEALLGDLISVLQSKYGDNLREAMDSIRGLRTLVDGREAALLGGMEAPLNDGCTVVFLPPIAGG
jgi:MoaD family protein